MIHNVPIYQLKSLQELLSFMLNIDPPKPIVHQDNTLLSTVGTTCWGKCTSEAHEDANEFGAGGGTRE